MDDRDFDVIIVGAGIAGLSTAYFLGGQGLKVCLLDNNSFLPHITFNTLASFIDLNRYNLSESVIASKISEVYFRSTHFCIKKTGNCYILNKRNLYEELLKKSRKLGVIIKSGITIEKFNQDNSGRVVFIGNQNGDKYSATIFVDATGVEGFFSRKLGLQDNTFASATGLEYNVKYLGPQYRAELYIGKLFEGGYGWLFPLGGGRAILGFGSFNENVKSQLKEKLNAMFEVNFIKKIVKKDNEELKGGTIPITNVKTSFVYKNVVCVGDSVSQVNPVVGEGHRFIIEAAKIASHYIRLAITKNDFDLLKGYETDWNKHFFTDYKWSVRIQKMAGWASKNDWKADIGTLFLATKRNKTFQNLIGGHISAASFFLP